MRIEKPMEDKMLVHIDDDSSSREREAWSGAMKTQFRRPLRHSIKECPVNSKFRNVLQYRLWRPRRMPPREIYWLVISVLAVFNCNLCRVKAQRKQERSLSSPRRNHEWISRKSGRIRGSQEEFRKIGKNSSKSGRIQGSQEEFKEVGKILRKSGIIRGSRV